MNSDKVLRIFILAKKNLICYFQAQRSVHRKDGGPQYVQITVQEWENLLLTLERHKRFFRQLGIDA